MDSVKDLPHTLTYAIMYRERLDSFNELPKDKRPPRNLWDKPYALSKFLETVWDKDKKKEERDTGFVFDYEDVE